MKKIISLCSVVFTDSTGPSAFRCQTVHSLRQNSGRGSLTRPSRSAEQVGMAGRSGVDLVFQYSYDMLLTQDRVERLWSEASVQCLIHTALLSL